MDETLRTRLDATVKGNKIVLFMKGNRAFPQCGFSATVIQILNQLGAPYETVNVLADGAVREGIKEYSQWPTIPQLYVGGEFVGGCDIVKSLNASGELQQLLGVEVGALPPQVQSLTPQAYQAMRKAGEPHRLWDVRTPEERRAASIEGSRLLDQAGQDELMVSVHGSPESGGLGQRTVV
jgi:monothiol glutaredoxin